MKKLYALLAVIALTLLCTVNVFAAGPDLNPAIEAGKVIAEAGEEVKIPLTLSDNPGLLGATVSVSYDDKLTLTNVIKGEAFTGLTMTKPGDYSANPVRVVWIGIEPDSSNGVIANLVFTAPEEAGTYPIVLTYEPGDIIDADLEEANISMVNGSVTVESKIDENEQVRQLVESIENMDPEDRKSVEEIRWAYNTLTDEQKEQIPEETLKKLTDAEDAFRKEDEEKQANLQAAAEVENAIETMDSQSEESIGNARALYEALTDAQKELVTKEILDKLESAEKALAEAKEEREADRAAADSVIAKIGELPEDLTTDDTALVQSVRDEYEKLTDAQKILVGEENLAKLVAAEEKVKEGGTVDPGPQKITKIEECEVFLEEQHFTYDGKAKEPSVTVKAGSEVLIPGEDYEAVYDNNIEPGTAKVTITGKGDYSGSAELTFEITPCTHKWNEGNVTTEATCTEPGERTYACEVCGKTKTEVIPATGHSYKTEVKEPTCTERGYTVYTCESCGDSYKSDYTDSSGHNYHTEVKEPTCTEQGYTEYICETCGESYKSDYTAPSGHEYTTEVVEPTETEKGYTIYTCKKCGDSYKGNYTEILSAEYKTEVVEPTCTDDGYTLYTNLKTGEEHKEAFVEELGHDYKNEVIEPTCTERGYTIYTCAVCGDNYHAEFKDAVGHSFDEGVVTKEATEEEDGVKTYTCLACGEKKEEVIPAARHQYDEGTVTKEASCTEKGEITHTCAECDAVYKEVTEPLGHHYISVVTEPTCTERGYTTFTCDRCGDTYIDQYVEAAGHHFSEAKTEPTCTKKGFSVYTCDVCGETRTDNYTEVKGHNYKTQVTEPTCTEKGFTTYTCEDCGETYVDNYTEPVGHKYKEEIIEPTCTEDGHTLYTCETCGDSYKGGYTQAHGHSYKSVVTEPTCTERGFTTYTCDHCGDSYTDQYTEPSGHKYTSEVSEPTCTEEGYTLYTCETCGDSYKGDFIQSSGHTPSEVMFENVRESADGISVFYDEVIHCQVCNEEISRKTKEAVLKNVKNATCTEDGFTGNAYNADGTILLLEGTVLKAKGNHTWNEGRVTKEATLTEEGIKTYTCTVCGETKTEAVPRIKPIDISKCTIVLDDKDCVYDGDIQYPTVTVSYKGKTLSYPDDFDFDAENNTHAGEATLVFYGKGAYSGTVSKTFTIKKASQALNVSCATSVVSGKTVKITTKGVGKITFKSSNAKVAAVNVKGVITGKNPGSATITITAAGNGDYNAAKKTLKITVKPVSLKGAKVTCPSTKVWTGWALTPVPTVKVGSKVLKKGTDFTLTFKNNKNVGKATIIINGKGIYSGSITRTFTINPKGTSISRLTPGSKKLTVKWKKQSSQTTGYQIQYSSVSNFKTQKIITVSNPKTVSKAIGGLAKKRKYYVRIRTFKTVNGKKYYSTWSAVKNAVTR